MNEKRYKKRLEFQQGIIARQSEQIESLKLQIENLKKECAKKDETINSVISLKNELSQNITEIEKNKKEYQKLIEELKRMKDIINQTIYKGRWRLIKLLMK